MIKSIVTPLFLKYPKKKHYDFGKIDWDEFWNVVSGNGFCNKERIKNHINAHIEGEWVREAAIAYANKNKNGIKA